MIILGEPADKCCMPYSKDSFAHCVPFPAPGPPKTKTTLGFGPSLMTL